jgi:KUP system potassium uptake protein
MSAGDTSAGSKSEAAAGPPGDTPPESKAPASVAAPLGVSRQQAHGAHPSGHEGHLSTLVLAALGVVFGDIGTSPLYALKECFTEPHGAEVTPENVFGVLSLMLWSLFVVVAIKYVSFIMKADNEGEGGILALLALVPREKPTQTGAGGPLVLLVLFGAALLYGDGVITPAISVLSAVEGLNVVTDAMKEYVVPLTVVILAGLFAVQRKGTEGIGVFFGPIMVVWFLALAALGVTQIIQGPAILAALNPLHALRFLTHNGAHGFLVLGAVVLCVTGGEALYADMGHFGRRSIRIAWYAMVMPSLMLNYFGQGVLLLAHPEYAKTSTFFEMVPHWGIIPMVILSTAATVIASQALISGAFSLTRQAVQLGFCPRVTVIHTSEKHEGQIYIPEVNTALCVACIVIVLAFQSSSKLAAAYGIAVTGTMSITSVVYYVVVTRTWGWPAWKAAPLVAFFMLFDLAFLGANAVKIKDQGWVPLAMALVVFTAMTTWKTGRRRLAEYFAQSAAPLDAFLDEVRSKTPPRVNGTAVFMSQSTSGVPAVLRHHFLHNKVLHEQVVLLSILSENVPFVSPRKRIVVEELPEHFYRITARFGFMETPRIPAILEAVTIFGLEIDPDTVTFYLGRESLLATSRPGMARWRKGLFSYLSRNARTATSYFGIPADRVVELGMQVEL